MGVPCSEPRHDPAQLQHGDRGGRACHPDHQVRGAPATKQHCAGLTGPGLQRDSRFAGLQRHQQRILLAVHVPGALALLLLGHQAWGF